MKRSFFFGLAVFSATIFFIHVFFKFRLVSLGLFVLFQTCSVFLVGMMWLMAGAEFKINPKAKILIVPLFIFAFGITRALVDAGVVMRPDEVELKEAGIFLLSRYQLATWLASITALAGFIIAGSVMTKEDQ